jgi:2,5-diamino-6-(ribosylamino)-4(3H)-pyrimidinone 5'-phosphate reductase
MPVVPRPFVRLNYAMTADGKISAADGSFSAFGSRRDRDRMDALRAEADLVLIGAGTLRVEDPPLRVADAARRRQRVEGGRSEQPRRGVLSASLDLPPAGRFFAPAADRPFILTVDAPPAARADRLAERVELIRAGRDQVDLPRALSLLQERGIRQLLLEGGGAANAAFLAAGLVDEIFLTLCPLVAGGVTATTPVGGAGFVPGRMPRLRLVQSEPCGDEIFCRYEVLPAAGPAPMET